MKQESQENHTIQNLVKCHDSNMMLYLVGSWTSSRPKSLKKIKKIAFIINILVFQHKNNNTNYSTSAENESKYY